MKTIGVGTGPIWGTAWDDTIWFKSDLTSPWIHIEGKLKQINVGHGGDVWGVDADGKIYYYN